MAQAMRRNPSREACAKASDPGRLRAARGQRRAPFKCSKGCELLGQGRRRARRHGRRPDEHFGRTTVLDAIEPSWRGGEPAVAHQAAHRASARFADGVRGPGCCLRASRRSSVVGGRSASARAMAASSAASIAHPTTSGNDATMAATNKKRKRPRNMEISFGNRLRSDLVVDSFSGTPSRLPLTSDPRFL